MPSIQSRLNQSYKLGSYEKHCSCEAFPEWVNKQNLEMLIALPSHLTFYRVLFENFINVYNATWSYQPSILHTPPLYLPPNFTFSFTLYTCVNVFLILWVQSPWQGWCWIHGNSLPRSTPKEKRFGTSFCGMPFHLKWKCALELRKQLRELEGPLMRRTTRFPPKIRGSITLPSPGFKQIVSSAKGQTDLPKWLKTVRRG